MVLYGFLHILIYLMLIIKSCFCSLFSLMCLCRDVGVNKETVVSLILSPLMIWCKDMTVFYEPRCYLSTSLLLGSCNSTAAMSAAQPISVASLYGTFWDFSLGLAEYECPLVWLTITLPPACLCFFPLTLKTWTMMTQAIQSAPQGKYSTNKNNKWSFYCSQMWEEVSWYKAKSPEQNMPPTTSGSLD